MRRLVYIIFTFLLLACAKENFPEEQIPSGISSQIVPAARVESAILPPAATKALINSATVAKMEANALRIDEDVDGDGSGTYSYGGWDQAYLLEAAVASAPSSSKTGYLRSMYLNPVQEYKERYHTRMISWYPKTCNLYKDDKGNASVMHFEAFRQLVDPSVYTVDGEGDATHLALNFSGLDGSKDVMVSNIVEGQQWHVDDGSEPEYRYPFGQNDTTPKYTNIMTYKHYLSAVKVYASAENSDQVVSMWGAIKSVMVRKQPSSMSVILPDPDEMDYESIKIDNFVQLNPTDDDDYGEAVFSDKLVDFPLIKTAMYGDDANNPSAEDEVAEDSPHLKLGQTVYLGYALIKPNVEKDQKLELDIHTESGILSVSVPMSSTKDGITTNYFEPGYIYNVNVNFNTQGAIADIVLSSGSGNYYDLSAGQDFGAQGHDYKYANCYVIDPTIAGYDGYAFNATTVGNGESGLYFNSGFDRTSVDINPVRAGLLWESSQGLVTHVELLYGYVRFKVKPGVEGNAVIAVYDSQRKVLWSWHIWILTDELKNVSHTIGSNTVVLMDRNLGATSANPDQLLETYGLYYQWGRKDPSMGPEADVYLPQSTVTMRYYDYYGAEWNYAGVVTMAQPTLRDGVENPMYLVLPTDFSMNTYQYDWLYTNIDNLWGDYDHTSQDSESIRQKTIYDPCPFGYMVPQDEISTLFATYAPTWSDKGLTIGDSFFPYAGYKGVDRGVSSLSVAWRYVGHKGDYMSSKIEKNKHRSRTYISKDAWWVEYGADSDGDGAGDAQRQYSSIVYADDMANRRTAASVRCIKRSNALNSSVYSRFYADRSYIFADDLDWEFTYSAEAYGCDRGGNDAVILSAYIDVDKGDSRPETVWFSSGGSASTMEGKIRDIPVPDVAGTYRYRFVAETSSGAISRVSYPVRVFDLNNIKINGTDYDPETPMCIYGTKYGVTFEIDGIDQDFNVYVNGVQAETSNVSINAFTARVYISDHLHFQICDANGVVVASKECPVKMKGLDNLRFYIDITKPVTFEEYYQKFEGKADGYIYNPNDYRDEPAFIYKATELEAGALYFIGTYKYSTPWFNPNYWRYGEHGKEYENGDPVDVNASSCLLFPGDHEAKTLDYIYSRDINPKDVFLFHKDDSKAGGVSSDYLYVTAGAWRTLIDGKYLTEDFKFSSDESDAVYTTVANGWGTPQGCVDIDFCLGNTGQYLQCDRWAKTGNRDDDFFWWSSNITDEYKWRIYKIQVEEKSNN